MKLLMQKDTNDMKTFEDYKKRILSKLNNLSESRNRINEWGHNPRPMDKLPGGTYIRVYKSNSENIDNITVVPYGNDWSASKNFDGSRMMLALDEEDGRTFSQWTSGFVGHHIGKRVDFSSLPEALQKHIIARIENDDEDLSKYDKVNESAKKDEQNEFWWVRLGDNADYISFNSFKDAIEHIREANPGKFIKFHGWGKDVNGVDTENFSGNNYISLFFGDKDAQPFSGMNQDEQNYTQKHLNLNRVNESKSELFWWVRLGDNADYEQCINLVDAIERIQDAEAGKFENFVWVKPHEANGLTTENYWSENYISLFLGDKNAKIVRGLNQKEQDFVKNSL